MLLGSHYVVSGRGTMAVNVTHPSVLDEDRLEYRLYLSPDLLPEMEELLMPGPLHEEVHVEVSAISFQMLSSFTRFMCFQFMLRH